MKVKQKIQKLIYICFYIIISISLSNCKPPNPFINLQTKVIDKKEARKLPKDKVTQIKMKLKNQTKLT